MHAAPVQPEPQSTPLIGLTGGLGVGKSTALATLSRLGAAVLSTDAVVHELYETAAVRDAVVARWGPDVAPAGQVDRSVVAGRVFSQDAERKWLEALLWPLVRARMLEWVAQVRSSRPAPRAAVVETPLLFEAGLDHGYDFTIAIVSDEQVRRDRAAGRGHVLVDERAARQLSQEEKARRATFAVRNDGSLEQLEQALSAVLEKVAP
jgi:dephospho-CoA kinase